MSSPFKPHLLAACIISALTHAAVAETKLPTVYVQASGITYADMDAPYASEVHSREKIVASGATTLVDYLAQNTSLNVMPSYGNRFSPLVDMRGYGIGNGYQNIAITVDGRSLNEIDLSSPLLASIPLDAIDHIEITKGSGSVAFGDGATAGSIQIYTRPQNGAAITAITGSHGFNSLDLSGGVQREWGEFSASASNNSSDGYSKADTTGYRDESINRTERAKLVLKPTENIKLTAEGSNSYIDIRYPNSLTLAQYNQDPAQNGGNVYTHQNFDTKQWRLSGEIDFGQGWSSVISHNNEDKTSRFLGAFPFTANYDYQTDEVLLKKKGQKFDISAGWNQFDGARTSATDTTHKKSDALFVQGGYQLGLLYLSGGFRQDRISYAYRPQAGTALSRDQNLTAWDLGANYRIDDRTTVFTNYNSAFQAPDIDRFFTWMGTFNAFIVPAKSRTFNVGFNRDDANNRLRATWFYSRLNNEIYFEPVTFTNTNLDRTHKYGLELQDTWQATDQLALSVLYTYTRAFIDETSQRAGAYNGKELPGVSRHGLNLGLAYQWDRNYSLNLNHVWRSDAYSMEDFANNLAQRQAAYQVTNATVRYRQADWEAFAGVSNLFDRKNGLWVRDNGIYPVDFTRTFKLGVKKNF